MGSQPTEGGRQPRRARLQGHQKEPPLPAPTVEVNGVRTVFPKHILSDYANQWENWWQGKPHGTDCHLPFDDDLSPLTPADIRRTAASFKATTAAPDGLAPKSIAFLSDPCLAALATLFHLFDRYGWPPSEQLVLTVLIPKKDGGLRPIALFWSLYRIYSKARAYEARSWAAGPGCSSLCNNGANRWVGDGTWRNQIRTGTDRTNHRADFLLDLKKA
jgi:hypothetical protein